MNKLNFLLLVCLIFSMHADAQGMFSNEELIGKGSPALFGEKINLRKEAYEAFLKMKTAAAKEGIDIKIVSSYRSFQHQKNIWERKYKQYIKQGLAPQQAIEKIIEYSTIPGTSRHHWGTDIDIVDNNGKQEGDVLVEEKFHGNGPFCKLKEWMDKNANSYGFYLVYTNNANRKGFKYEPWHYSYKPISKPMLAAYRKINIKEILLREKLFGIEYFSDDFVDKYLKENVLDINTELL